MRLALVVALCLAVLWPADWMWARADYGLKRRPLQKPPATRVHPGLQSGTLMLKFADDSGVAVAGGKLYFPDGRPVSAVNRLVDAGRVIGVTPEFTQDKATLLRWRREGERRAAVSLADLSAYFRLALAPDLPLAEAARLCDLLNRSLDIELAFLEGEPQVAGDIDPATPNFEPQQDYLKVAPGGVDAYASWTYPGGKGEGVTICDIEFGWHDDHEDLSKLADGYIGGAGGPDNHGTAVMGEMVADSAVSALSGIGYGVTGIAFGASARMVSVRFRSVAQALVLAAESLAVGDIVLIELQQPGPNGTLSNPAYVPMEWTPSVFDAIQTLTANGYIVCEAAGNGSQNLNDAIYGGWFDTLKQHSGAVICGAGAPPSGAYGPDRSRLSFSNYGMRVDLQGHGNAVVTTGYGGLFDPGDARQRYTATFSGTSSATPIVAASVACIQGRFKYLSGGYTMTARQIRDLLYATGSLQTGTTSQHIGRRPNLAAAMPQVAAQSAYPDPRGFSLSLLSPPVAVDTLWLVNPHGSPTTYSITIVDSLPILPSPAKVTAGGKAAWLAGPSTEIAAAPTPWITPNPAAGVIPAGDRMPVALTFDGTQLKGSYFGTHYKARIDVQVDGAAGTGSIPVPVLALAQDSLHGDTIQIVTAAITHRATSETNLQGWDYNDLSTSGWLFDGSFLLGRRVNRDTVVYRDIFGNARKWRARDFWQADSTSWPGYVIWRDSSMTDDSTLGLVYEAWVPVTGDSAEFVYWRVGPYGRLASYTNVLFGIAGDWDLPASFGVNNLGAFDTTRQMVYQTGNAGYEQNAAGFALLRAQARGGVIGSNVADVYPTGGFASGKLYRQMHTPGFRVDASNVDLHAILTPFFGTVPLGTPLSFEVVVLSSRTGVPGLNAGYARAKKLSDTLRFLACPIAVTGDVNVDGLKNSADLIYLVNHVFKGGPAPLPIGLSGDVDCSGAVTSADIIYMVNHVFRSGPAPCNACTIY